MKIPLLDLNASDAPYVSQIQEAVSRVIQSTQFCGGPEVETFERELAAFCQTKYCVSVNSGTAALHLILSAYRIGSGDEVITVPNSFIATAEAIVHTGARPVFVDVDPVSLTLDPSGLESVITSRTKAIIPVHLYGCPADMTPILKIAKMRRLKVIEDACQAHGALYHGRKTGSLGDAAAFSFYPSKNLGAYGDGGAVVTSDQALAEKIRSLGNHGRLGKNEHVVTGYTERLDSLQAAILAVKLRHLEKANEKRLKIAQYYSERFSRLPVKIPVEQPEKKAVYHLYVIRTEKRDSLATCLRGQGIACDIHYPIPIHLQEAFRSLGYTDRDFQTSVQTSGEILSLPIYPGMPDAFVEKVVDSVCSFFRR